jgi:hypothetical protein
LNEWTVTWKLYSTAVVLEKLIAATFMSVQGSHEGVFLWKFSEVISGSLSKDFRIFGDENVKE